LDNYLAVCSVVQEVEVDDGELVEGNALLDSDLEQFLAELGVLGEGEVGCVGREESAREAGGIAQVQVEGLDGGVEVVAGGGEQGDGQVLDVELDGGAAAGAVAVEAHVAGAVLDDDGAVGAGKVLGVEVAVGGVEGEVVGDLLLGEFGGGVWRREGGLWRVGAAVVLGGGEEVADGDDAVEEGGDEVGVDGDGVGDGDSHLVDEPRRKHRLAKIYQRLKVCSIFE